MRWRRVLAGVAVLGVAVVAGGALLLHEGHPPPGQAGADQSFEVIERGRAVATAADCVACHSAPGGKPWAGGLALRTPFGTLAAPNITPDRDTGIGLYTEAEFRHLLRDGIGRGGKHIYPAMPYTAYTRMTDEDIHALWAYLTTIEPVANAVEVNRLPFPFNIRLSLIGWNLLNFGPAGPVPDRTDKSPEWNRGRYLVDAPGHCGTCHSTKNVLGGDTGDGYLRGGKLEGWYAPNITPGAHSGVGSWSKEQLVAYLQTGANHQAIAAGPMGEAVWNSTSHMPVADLRAMATYLLDGPAGAARPAALAADVPPMRQGAAVYKDTCAACHNDNGQGVPSLFPTLAGSPAVQQQDANNLVRVVLAGARGVATDARPTAPAMPPLGWRLGDQEVAAVVTFIRNSWGNSAPAVADGDVSGVRRSLAE